MITRAQKWGNSLAFRLPRAYAEHLGLEPNSAVEITLSGNQLCITPVSEATLTLEKLLDGVNGANLHGEIETGPARGNEVW